MEAGLAIVFLGSMDTVFKHTHRTQAGTVRSGDPSEVAKGSQAPDRV